jgi:hypothetical protein
VCRRTAISLQLRACAGSTFLRALARDWLYGRGTRGLAMTIFTAIALVAAVVNLGIAAAVMIGERGRSFDMRRDRTRNANRLLTRRETDVRAQA